MEISEIVKKNTFSSEDVINIIEEIGKNKDIILIKNDGLRDNNKYSVIIILSNAPNISFRCDSDFLNESLKKVLLEYVSYGRN